MIPRKKKAVVETDKDSWRVPAIPAWAARGGGATEQDCAFSAGAALAALDVLQRSGAPWLGAWRRRQALKCAVEGVRLIGRNEDEAALRDAWLLRRPQDDPGPAGNVYAAWRDLTAKGPCLTSAVLQRNAARLAIRWNETLADIPLLVDEIGQSGKAAPFAAAELMRRILSERGDAEVLAWWAADAMLAERLGWAIPLPLMMTERYGQAFRSMGGRGRIRSGDAAFARAICQAITAAAVEALRLATEVARRAEKLDAVTPQLRAKGAGDALDLLFGDDAVSGTLATAKLSRWASRRLFERLVELDAVREFSGRPNYRIYGL